jgi:hypothetical protein
MKPYGKFTVCWLGLLLLSLGGTLGRGETARSAELDPSEPYQKKTEAQEATMRMARETLHLKFEGEVKPAYAENFSGMGSENLKFTRRLDSRTFISYDRRFSSADKSNLYRGTNEDLLEKTRGVLRALEIPVAEVASEKVLLENTQAGHRDVNSGRFILEKPETGKRYALVTRQINGLPVFSSRALIGLMGEGEIGSLEVHWPVIPAKVTEDARQYERVVRGGWRAPEHPGTYVESVTVGIIHSPAAGTAMDVYPTIRVIYAPNDKRLGMKAVLDFDPEGKAVPAPRTFLEPPREDLKLQRATPQP